MWVHVSERMHSHTRVREHRLRLPENRVLANWQVCLLLLYTSSAEFEFFYRFCREMFQYFIDKELDNNWLLTLVDFVDTNIIFS